MATGLGYRKHRFETDVEFEELRSIKSPTKFSKLHGILATLSPIKSVGGYGYFDETLIDGQKKLQLVGFDTKI